MTMIEEMEAYAKTHKIPIMQKEGIDFLCAFIQKHQIFSVLEIGSAIGYSAIRMAMLHPGIKVTTIERDEERYAKARAYIEACGLEEQITLVQGDALETVIGGSYDMLFIDAAKAQYIRFFERYEKNVRTGGYIITDNLKFHGYVEHKELVKTRRLRRLVTKLQDFVDYLKQREDYETEFFDFGDGVGISRKK